MRRLLAVLSVSLLGGFATTVAADGLEVRLGAFVPRADSGARAQDRYDLFQDQFSVHAVKKSDWVGALGGVELNLGLSRNLEIGLSVDGYERNLPTHYRTYTHGDDSEIEHTLKLSIVPVGVSLRILPATRRMQITPYAVFGADLIAWRYEAFGDFIDFGLPNLPIQYAEYRSDGVAGGVHVGAGVRVPITYDLSLTGEVRYMWATQNMGGDFDQNKIDLSGATATLGVRLRF